MFQQRNIITAVELGTTKACVLIGEAEGGDDIVIIGHGEAAMDGAVVKGEIVDMDGALEALSEALDEADKSADCEIDRSNIYIAVTGSDIQSCRGVGTVLVRNEDNKVTENDINEAVQNAQVKPMHPSKVIINTFDSYYMLDGARQLRNPLNQVAHKLEAFIHLIYADRNRIRNFENALRDVGFEEGDGTSVFSAVAAAYGVLSDAEKENGVLLIEMGGGSTEFIAVHNYGIIASGVLGVGFDHVANDLSIGLDLHISLCRKLLLENELPKELQEGSAFIKVNEVSAGSARKLPISSIERIIDLRLREIFGIIKKDLQKDNLLHNLSCGGVLSGGGALFPTTLEVFKNVMEIPARVGTPLGANGAVTDIDSPRYSVAWGLLKYGNEMRKVVGASGNRSLWEKMLSGMDSMSTPIFKGFSNLKNSIKF